MFRFTIRDVLWLTVVVGLSVGWWMDHQTLARTIARIDQVLGEVHARLLDPFFGQRERESALDFLEDEVPSLDTWRRFRKR
jgi:hypothetical protein